MFLLSIFLFFCYYHHGHFYQSLLMRLSLLSFCFSFFHRDFSLLVCLFVSFIMELISFCLYTVRPLPFPSGTINSISLTKIPSHSILPFLRVHPPILFLLFPCFFSSLALPSSSRPLPLRLAVTPLRLPAPWGSNMSVVTHKRRDISLTPHYSRVRPHSLGRSVVGVVLPSKFNQISFWILKRTAYPACV